MLVIDSHLDLSWNALNWNRDFTLPVEEIRRSEAGMNEARRGRNTVCFPEMRKGDVGICLATVLARSTRENTPLLDYRSQEIASAMGHGQRIYYKIMEDCGQLRMLKDWGDIARHVEEWNSGSRQRIGYILSMEGADPILSPADAARWWDAGLRVVGLSHYGQGIYAGGTTATSGLTARGFEMLAAFQELGMVVDVTHLADEGFWQVTEKYQGSILASHNNCRALVPGQRQFSDDQIRKLIERGTVIGAAFDSWMLHAGYVQGETDNSQVKLKSVIGHIDHICQLAGNARHVAIGSDLDGGFGKEQSPSDLETIADLQKIPLLLKERGYSQDDISGIMYGNWLRFFQHALPAR